MQEMQPIHTDELEDLNIERFTPMASPAEIKLQAPMTDRAAEVVRKGRSAIRKILRGEDKRLLVITGPCSIHDPKAAMDYAQRLAKLSEEVSDQLLLVMRVYFEKPRTVTGWKGYVNDPHMDGSFEIAEGMLKARQLLLKISETGLPLAFEKPRTVTGWKGYVNDPHMDGSFEIAEGMLKARQLLLKISETGLPLATEALDTVTGWKGYVNDPHMDGSFEIAEGMLKARQLLLKISETGLPLATEALDPFSPQYLGELISWYAIGARTSESQTHREMASGLSAPVGFKNGTDGSLDTAINAIKSSMTSHHFLGMYEDGRSAVVFTRGNRYGHLVLRGGGGRPNYDTVSIMLAEKALEKAG